MKRRLLSIITTLALFLSLCPPGALASTGVGSGNPVYETGADTSAAPVRKVRSGEPAIAITGSFVFANGIPIVIRENSGITSIYHAESGELLSGATDVSACSIYGGWYSTASHSASTSIVMESGTVKNIFGSCFGPLNGDTSIVIKGGKVDQIYGAGYSSAISGKASVVIDGGSVGFAYGGSYVSGSVSSTKVTVNGGAVSSVYGGSSECAFEGTAGVAINGGNVTLAYGGSENGTHKGSTSVVLRNGAVGWVYGGGNSSTMEGNTSVVLSGGTVGWVYGGGSDSAIEGAASVTVNPGVKVWGLRTTGANTEEKGTVFGGGKGGSVTSTEVVFNGGDVGELFGGGETSACGSTHVRMMGPAEDSARIYGGGLSGSVGKAVLELHSTATASNNRAVFFYGNGRGDTVETVEIRIGKDAEASAATFYANNPFDTSSTVGSASFDITLSSDGPYIIPQISALDGSGVTGKVSVRFHGRGEADQDYGTRLIEVDEVTVEDSRVVLGDMGDDGRSTIKLDRLKVAATGEAVFPDYNVEAAIGELAGSGTIWFAKEYPDTTLTPVTVDRISATSDAPLKIGHRGPNMTEELWKNAVLFQGRGVETLTDASCFVSADPKYVPAKTDDGKGIQMKDIDTRVQAYITPPYFDKSSYAYGDAMTITLGLTAKGNPIPGARLEIRGGSEGLRTIASVILDENGEAVVSLPVNDIIWDSRKVGLQAIYWGSEQYLSNFYGISLKDSPSSMDYLVTKADIELPGELPAPVPGAIPTESLPVGEDAFYTAQVVWAPAHAAFQFNTAYAAHIRIIPKEGYSLDPEKIGSITFQGQELTIPASTEPDGSLLLSSAAVFPPAPGFRVDLAAVPTAGGTVTGAGLYLSGSQVTVRAVPAEGYIFQRWTEDGTEVSAAPEYTFTLAAHRSLRAVFHAHQWGQWTAEDGGTQHSRTCEGCGAVERGDHEYGGDTDAVCSICGYERPIQSDEQTKIEQGELTEVPEGLKGTAFDTVDKIKAELSQILISQTDGYTEESLAFYDVSLMVSTDGGRTWDPATKDNFPAGGLSVTLPYPEGTGQSTHDFLVTHMFTTGDFGRMPGETEQPEVTKTAKGIRFTVMGLSPIAVAWKDIAAEPTPPPTPTPTPTPTPPDGFYWNGGGSSPATTYAVTVEKSEHGTVTASRVNAASGSTITLTVTPDSGYVLDTLSVTDSSGIEVKLTGKNGKYTFTMPGRAVTVKATFAPLPEDKEQPCDGGAECPSRAFADLGSVGTWYHEAVDYVLRNGLMGGYSNGLFGPEDTLTRAQFAQLLYNKAGRPAATGGSAFPDVANGAWCAPAVAWAAEQGIIGGYDNGLFGPNDNITREQLAAMLWRYAGNPAATDKELHFTDAGKASGYALEALRWAVENGVMSGKGGGVLDPKGLATRAQAAQMMENFVTQ